jgi:hypothetical protein
VAEFFGWLSAITGTVGSLLLVRPLFILLKYREAAESLARAQQKLPSADPDVQQAVKSAQDALQDELFKHRKDWKCWVWAGLIFLSSH